MTPTQSFKIALMDVDKFVEQNNLLEVTSSFIHEPSSTQYASEGLFSERIFGQVASRDRLIRMGYIELGCKVFHPVVFQCIKDLKRFYIEIMSGKSYAKWDAVEKDFTRANEEEEGADTGFSFFLSYFDKINWIRNSSLKRDDRLDLLKKYKNQLLISKCIVCPAGWRDLNDEDGRLEKDSINTHYIALLERARAMPPGAGDDPIYDAIHYAIQRKVIEIYEYLQNFSSGKRGFFQSKFTSRSVAQGTRNVITSANMEAESPDSPQYLKQDEVKVPLFQAAKGFISLVIYWMKSLFYGTIIQPGVDQVPLIDPETFNLIYLPIDDRDKDSMLTSEGITKMIDRFRDVDYRWRPVVATARGKQYYLFMVYDDGEEVFFFRNLEETKIAYKHLKDKDLDMNKIRPLTYAEMVYCATYFASLNRFGTITRYPITDEQSIFTAKTHLMSTSPSRVVNMLNLADGSSVQLPEYPCINKGFIDALMFHPSRRSGLSADFDGDTVTWIPILGNDANEELEKYVHSVANFVLPNGDPMMGGDDLIDLTMYSMTEEPPNS